MFKLFFCPDFSTCFILLQEILSYKLLRLHLNSQVPILRMLWKKFVQQTLLTLILKQLPSLHCPPGI